MMKGRKALMMLNRASIGIKSTRNQYRPKNLLQNGNFLVSQRQKSRIPKWHSKRSWYVWFRITLGLCIFTIRNRVNSSTRHTTQTFLMRSLARFWLGCIRLDNCLIHKANVKYAANWPNLAHSHYYLFENLTKDTLKSQYANANIVRCRFKQRELVLLLTSKEIEKINPLDPCSRIWDWTLKKHFLNLFSFC